MLIITIKKPKLKKWEHRSRKKHFGPLPEALSKMTGMVVVAPSGK